MNTNEPKRVDGFVPNERMLEFERKVARMQTMASKLGLPAWEVTFGEKEWRPVQILTEDSAGHPFQQERQLEGRSVTIVGNSPVISGWRFLAKIEHDAGGNLVKGMTGDRKVPEIWHTCGPNCDHCKVARARNDTYMLADMATGEIKQVGSSCLTDFLGEQARDPERIMGMYEYLSELGREFLYDPDEVDVSMGSMDYGVRPERIMAAVLKIIEEDSGYISAEKGEYQCIASTGDRVRAAFWSKKPIAVVPEAGHIERASEVVQWLKEQRHADSAWLSNIGILASREGITAKNAGLFASGYVAWNRALEQRLRAENGSGEWIGIDGEKVAIRATLEFRGGYETQYGITTILKFRDEEGNGLVWKTQSPPTGIVVGASYQILATVKGHGEYQGEKQTEIIRAKLAELELFSFGAVAGYKKFASVAVPDVVDDRGHTPLIKAVWGDKIDHAKILLNAGADANFLNQGELPVLAYATSVDMAKMLMEGGARAKDIGERELKEMAVEVSQLIREKCPKEEQESVSKGQYSGKILDVADGLATQRVGRGGEVVLHSVSRLSEPVIIGAVVDIVYTGGKGVVGGVGRGIGIG